MCGVLFSSDGRPHLAPDMRTCRCVSTAAVVELPGGGRIHTEHSSSPEPRDGYAVTTKTDAISDRSSTAGPSGLPCFPDARSSPRRGPARRRFGACRSRRRRGPGRRVAGMHFEVQLLFHTELREDAEQLRKS